MVEAADQMRTKSDRDSFVQVLVNGDPTAGERGPQLTALKLPYPVGESHRVVTRYYSLVLQREDQVKIFAAQRHEGGPALAGGNTEPLIELGDVLLAQKAVGGFGGNDAAPSQLLRQASLPGAKAAFAAPARLRGVSRNQLNAQLFHSSSHLGRSIMINCLTSLWS